VSLVPKESRVGINMKMVQQMQNRLVKIQQELAETIVEGTAGGGAVVARVTGAREFDSIKIDKSAVDPEDVEMVEDLVTVAIKDAMGKAAAINEEKLGGLTGGMKIPGLM
jgi:DNA-binding YbaB/EbfC family protein